MKRGGRLRRTARRETLAERLARDHFNTTVCDERCCYFRDVNFADEPRRPGHECRGPLDAHHLVDKQFIREWFKDLPEDEFVAILYAPVIGCPLCRHVAHDAVEKRLTDFIFWEELEDDCVEFCIRTDERYGELILPSGIRRKSLLGRLQERCPSREDVAGVEVLA